MTTSWQIITVAALCILSFHTRGLEGSEKREQWSPSFPVLLFPPNLACPTTSSATHLVGMASGQPLPKFGDWDVNNPSSAEGFTAIFNIARDEKKTGGNAGAATTPSTNEAGGLEKSDSYQYPRKSWKWFCCG